MAAKSPRPTPFELALAARQGKVKPEQLSGAARQLYNDKSLSNDQLGVVGKVSAPASKTFIKATNYHKGK